MALESTTMGPLKTNWLLWMPMSWRKPKREAKKPSQLSQKWSECNWGTTTTQWASRKSKQLSPNRSSPLMRRNWRSSQPRTRKSSSKSPSTTSQRRPRRTSQLSKVALMSLRSSSKVTTLSGQPTYRIDQRGKGFEGNSRKWGEERRKWPETKRRKAEQKRRKRTRSREQRRFPNAEFGLKLKGHELKRHPASLDNSRILTIFILLKFYWYWTATQLKPNLPIILQTPHASQSTFKTVWMRLCVENPFKKVLLDWSWSLKSVFWVFEEQAEINWEEVSKQRRCRSRKTPRKSLSRLKWTQECSCLVLSKSRD